MAWSFLRAWVIPNCFKKASEVELAGCVDKIDTTENAIQSTEPTSLLLLDQTREENVVADKQDIKVLAINFPDFSILPDIPWVRILSYLTEQDRLSVSMTCTRLNTLCLKTPSLWRTAELYFGVNHPGSQPQISQKRKAKFRLLSTELSALNSSSRYVNKVTIWLEDVKNLRFTCKSFKALKEATSTWKLASVNINSVRQTTTNSRCKLPYTIRKLLANFLTSEGASQLKRLSIRICPWVDNKNDVYILKLLLQAPFCDSLEILTVYWVARFNEFPEISAADLLHVTVALGRFKQVHDLTISSSYVSNDLLLALSSTEHCKVKKLRILDGYFPTAVTHWKEFLIHSPEVTIEMCIHLFLVCDSLEVSLPAYLPFTYFSLNRAVPQEDQRALIKLLPKYADHVEGILFECNDTLHDCEDDLLAMVISCRSLQVLSFYGKVRSTDIIKMASLKRQWVTFSFLSKNIIFPDQWTNSDQKTNLKKLYKDVSAKLGRPWKACSKVRPTQSAPNVLADVFTSGRVLRVTPANV